MVIVFSFPRDCGWATFGASLPWRPNFASDTLWASGLLILESKEIQKRPSASFAERFYDRLVDDFRSCFTSSELQCRSPWGHRHSESVAPRPRSLPWRATVVRSVLAPRLSRSWASAVACCLNTATPPRHPAARRPPSLPDSRACGRGSRWRHRPAPGLGMAATSVFAGVLIAKSGGFGLPIMGVQDQWRKVVLGSTSFPCWSRARSAASWCRPLRHGQEDGRADRCRVEG